MVSERRSRQVAVWLLALLVLLAALLPRVVTLADFLTEDESFHWVWRVRHFSGAVRQELWAITNLTGHPGVTTMWLGTLGRWLAERFAVPLEGMAPGSANVAYLAMLRLPLALVNSLAVLLGYLLLRRLVRPGVALLAALLWALSPFLIAHSRLLHLDALVTSFMTLSVLCLLLATTRSASARGTDWLAVAGSGALAGLALLTKAPSLLLLPLAGLLLVPGSPALSLWQRFVWIVPRYVLWLLVAALVFTAGWPAMWVEPVQAVGAVLAEVADNGAVPHHTGNFFLGQPVADPGPLFYPAVVLWRSTPLLLIGLLLLPLALRRNWRDGGAMAARERRVLLALGLFVLLFVAALTLAPKKFDRYLLPIWPSLAVLAAYGLLWLWQRAGSMRGPAARYLLAAGGALVLVGSLLWYHPYYLAYFNPLVGGSATAQRVLLVGWGEGMEQVGAWLRSRPDVDRSPVLTWGPRTLEPFIPGRTMYLNRQHVAEPASYAVLYIRAAQRQESQPAQEYVRSSAPPLYTLRMYGIDYAHIYQPPIPYDAPIDAVYGEGLHLRGYSQAQIGSTLVITPSWNIQAAQPGGLFSFVHVLAPDGARIAQVDVPIDAGMFDTWQAGQQFGSPLPIPLPADMPAGDYRVVLGVYDPETGTRIPLRQGEALPATAAGPETLLLTTFRHASRSGLH